jgi:hypothetical protein
MGGAFQPFFAGKAHRCLTLSMALLSIEVAW